MFQNNDKYHYDLFFLFSELHISGWYFSLKETPEINGLLFAVLEREIVINGSGSY